VLSTGPVPTASAVTVVVVKKIGVKIVVKAQDLSASCYHLVEFSLAGKTRLPDSL